MIKVSVNGFDKLQNAVNKIVTSANQEFVDKTLDELADIGIKTIDETYRQADFDGQPKHYSLSKEKTEDSISIVANGDTITFLEFGAGVYHNKDRDYKQANKLGMNIGKYGKGQGSRNQWYYIGEGGQPKQIKDKNGNIIGYNERVRFTRGTKASKGMLKACSEIDQNITKVIEGAIK